MPLDGWSRLLVRGEGPVCFGEVGNATALRAIKNSYLHRAAAIVVTDVASVSKIFEESIEVQ